MLAIERRVPYGVSSVTDRMCCHSQYLELQGLDVNAGWWRIIAGRTSARIGGSRTWK
jgi:hypothetical protein